MCDTYRKYLTAIVQVARLKTDVQNEHQNNNNVTDMGSVRMSEVGWEPLVSSLLPPRSVIRLNRCTKAAVFIN